MGIEAIFSWGMFQSRYGELTIAPGGDKKKLSKEKINL
jgi:hypothetical protein